jgi:hypothetical protein
VSGARDLAEIVRCLEALLPGVQAKGNGMVLGAASEDGRAIPFELLRTRLGHPRIRTGGVSR